MSNLGGWAIGQGMLEWIQGRFNGLTTIMELGSGSGSIELAKRFPVISVEHDPEWLSKTDGNMVVYAPIVDGWYDPRVMFPLASIMDPCLIIVDGPPARIGRSRFVDFFEAAFLSSYLTRVTHSRCRTVIFDDTNRPEDWEVAERFLGMVNRLSPKWVATRHQDGEKEFTVVDWVGSVQ